MLVFNSLINIMEAFAIFLSFSISKCFDTNSSGGKVYNM